MNRRGVEYEGTENNKTEMVQGIRKWEGKFKFAYAESMFGAVDSCWMVPHADKCLLCFDPVCGSAVL